MNTTILIVSIIAIVIIGIVILGIYSGPKKYTDDQLKSLMDEYKNLPISIDAFSCIPESKDRGDLYYFAHNKINNLIKIFENHRDQVEKIDPDFFSGWLDGLTRPKFTCGEYCSDHSEWKKGGKCDCLQGYQHDPVKSEQTGKFLCMDPVLSRFPSTYTQLRQGISKRGRGGSTSIRCIPTTDSKYDNYRQTYTDINNNLMKNLSEIVNDEKLKLIGDEYETRFQSKIGKTWDEVKEDMKKSFNDKQSVYWKSCDDFCPNSEGRVWTDKGCSCNMETHTYNDAKTDELNVYTCNPKNV